MSKLPKALKRRPGKSATQIKDAYDEDEAREYKEAHWIKLRIEARTRRRQFGDADGRVLDVACVTGVNFQYLPDTANIVDVNISRDLLSGARREASELDQRVELEQMDAQRLSFEEDSFDHVIPSLSTCTFPTPIAALNEMGRVCKPSGRIRLLEHHKWNFSHSGRCKNGRPNRSTTELAVDCTKTRPRS